MIYLRIIIEQTYREEDPMKILFTPVGNTDPISMYNEKEGSILHICRKYKPDKIYLYMSKEILKHHKEDNRYIKSLKKLYEGIGKELKYEVIKRPDLVDVHLLDYFFKDFREIINNIHHSYPREEIFLNVSSGTPAMKNALFVLSNFMNFKTIPIQVGTPVKRSNTNVDRYDPEAYNLVIAELNKNPDLFVDRTIKPEIKNLNYEIKREIIINHINKYNYQAALTTAETIRDFLSDKAYRLIKAGNERINLRRSIMISTLKGTGEKFHLYHGEEGSLIEYLLYLDITIKRGFLLEFIRGISPALFEIFKLFLEETYRLKLRDYTRLNKGILYWDEGKIKKENQLYSIMKSFYGGSFRFNDYVKTDHLLMLIDNEKIINLYAKRIPNKNLYDILSRLREVEKNARNIAAHEIVSITDEQLKRYVDATGREIFNDMKKLIKEIGLNIPGNVWNSYQLMNETIINSLD